MLNLNFNTIGTKSFEQERGDGFNSFPVQILLLGGGGGGGGTVGEGNGSGAGAGGFISASWTLPPLTTFDVVVGNGGEVGINASPGEGNQGQGGNGEDTKLVVVSTTEVVFNAIGGGGGRIEGSGGSTGGSSSGNSTIASEPTLLTPCILPFDATLAQRTGSLGGVSSELAGAGGGGVLTNGTDGGTAAINPAGGNAINKNQTFISALSVPSALAGGGRGAGRDNTDTPTAPLSGSGGGGHAGVINNPPPGVSNSRIGTPGASGLFAVRYQGLPKATGGEITQSGGFTTHLFLSSSQLVVSGRTNSTP